MKNCLVKDNVRRLKTQAKDREKVFANHISKKSTSMSAGEWTNLTAAFLYNGILLSSKKEQTLATCNNVTESPTHCTE